jgi:hypothetical protein
MVGVGRICAAPAVLLYWNRMAVLRRVLLLPALAVLLLGVAGCATIFGPQGMPGRDAYRTPEEARRPLSMEEKAVLASAKTLLGRPPESKVKVNGRTFMLDCIGTVRAIFWGAGYDIMKDAGRYGGGGVRSLYAELKAMNALHADRYPRPGDVIFWDNTYDANENGILGDDPLTHAGLVISVDPDGTIHYEHEHLRKGVIVEEMNLFYPREYATPQGKVLNSAMAMNSGISRKVNPAHWMSGDLWNSFGDILRNRRHFAIAGSPLDRSPPVEVLLAMRAPGTR